MFEVRIHGRGGQGVVTAAEVLSIAAFFEGKCSQAFPSFGSERMGAPVVAFCRMSEKPIRSREPVTAPDALIVQDPTLLGHVPVFEGLPDSGFVLINSNRTSRELGIEDLCLRMSSEHYCTVPATQLAIEKTGRPVPNAPLLGAFAALTGQIRIDSIQSAIKQRFAGAAGEANAAAALAAYELIRSKEPLNAKAS